MTVRRKGRLLSAPLPATSATSAGTWERSEKVWLALTTVLPVGAGLRPLNNPTGCPQVGDG